MKFTEYLEESSTIKLQAFGVISALQKNCKPFIDELKKTNQNKLLYRGSKKTSTKNIISVIPRQDRTPMDMPSEVHEYLDELFYAKFGWYPRSNGVFVTSSKSTTERYGKSFLFFPIGKYSFIYNPHIEDLFSYIDNEPEVVDVLTGYFRNEDFYDEYEYLYGPNSENGTWYYFEIDTGKSDKQDAILAAAKAEGVKPNEIWEDDLSWTPNVEFDTWFKKLEKTAIHDAEFFLEKTVNGYRDSNLGLAIKSKVEITFQCEKYYLVNSEFEKEVYDYIFKNKLPFNPKQLELEFEKSPKFRKEIEQNPEFKKIFHDPMLSKFGSMKFHKKFYYLYKKSKKGKQTIISQMF
jgi:hypothetical protein